MRSAFVSGVVVVCALLATTAFSEDRMDSNDGDSGMYVGAGGGIWLLPEEGVKYTRRAAK